MQKIHKINKSCKYNESADPLARCAEEIKLKNNHTVLPILAPAQNFSELKELKSSDSNLISDSIVQFDKSFSDSLKGCEVSDSFMFLKKEEKDIDEQDEDEHDWTENEENLVSTIKLNRKSLSKKSSIDDLKPTVPPPPKPRVPPKTTEISNQSINRRFEQDSLAKKILQGCLEENDNDLLSYESRPQNISPPQKAPKPASFIKSQVSNVSSLTEVTQKLEDRCENQCPAGDGCPYFSVFLEKSE